MKENLKEKIENLKKEKFQILFHEDLDGVMSAIYFLHYLQSIDYVSLKILGIYPSPEEEIKDLKLEGRKNVLLDYSFFQNESIYKNIDLLIDHHGNKKCFDGQDKFIINSAFKSNAEHVVHLLDLDVNQEDVSIISKIDSAGYNFDELQYQFFLSKEPQNSFERKLKIAIEISQILSLLAKEKYKNEKIITSVIRETFSNPTLENVYERIKYYFSCFCEARKMQERILQKNVDEKQVEDFNKSLPVFLQINYKKSLKKGTVKVPSIEKNFINNEKVISSTFEVEDNTYKTKEHLKVNKLLSEEVFFQNFYFEKNPFVFESLIKKVDYWQNQEMIFDFAANLIKKVDFEKKILITRHNYFDKNNCALPPSHAILNGTHAAIAFNSTGNRFLPYLDKNVWWVVRDFGLYFQISTSPFAGEEEKNKNLLDIMQQVFKEMEENYLKIDTEFFKSIIKQIEGNKILKQIISLELFQEKFEKAREIFSNIVVSQSGGHSTIININLNPIDKQINPYKNKIEQIKFFAQKVAKREDLELLGKHFSSVYLKSVFFEEFVNSLKVLFLNLFLKHLK